MALVNRGDLILGLVTRDAHSLVRGSGLNCGLPRTLDLWRVQMFRGAAEHLLEFAVRIVTPIEKLSLPKIRFLSKTY